MKRILITALMTIATIVLLSSVAMATSTVNLSTVQTDVNDTLAANWTIILGIVAALIVPVVVWRFAKRFIR